MADRHLYSGRPRTPEAPPAIRRSARPRLKAGPVAPGQVRATVLKAGHGRVYTGAMIDGAPETYEWGDAFVAAEATAKALEDRGLAEISA